MPKDLDLAVLFDLYAPLLSKRRREIFDDYYNADLSLAEIAENRGMTRQAVLDHIRHAESRLRAAESELHFAEYVIRCEKASQELLSLAQTDGTDSDHYKTAARICSELDFFNREKE